MSMGKDNENPQQCRLDMLLSHQLQGVKLIPQKCHLECTPNFYRGPTEQRRNAKILPPPTVLEPERKRRNVKNESLQGEGFNIQTHAMSTKCQSFPNNLQGAKRTSQKCHHVHAPASFIWCRDYLAEMPLLTRTKGRVNETLQKCQCLDTLPNQLKGSL
jgi:hypothetical protein